MEIAITFFVTLAERLRKDHKKLESVYDDDLLNQFYKMLTESKRYIFITAHRVK